MLLKASVWKLYTENPADEVCGSTCTEIVGCQEGETETQYRTEFWAGSAPQTNDTNIMNKWRKIGRMSKWGLGLVP